MSGTKSFSPLFPVALAAALVVAADQASKWLVLKTVAYMECIPVTGFFNIVHVRNRGAAFGFLSNTETDWQIVFFLATTVIALGAIVYLALQAGRKDRVTLLSLGGVAGGALGNAVDRVRFSAVLDFLDLHLAGWHWPAFNVADMAICLGALGIALKVLAPGKRA